MDCGSIPYEPGVELRVKLFKLPNDKLEKRFFLYGVEEIAFHGGYGWRSLEDLVRRFEQWKENGGVSDLKSTRI